MSLCFCASIRSCTSDTHSENRLTMLHISMNATSPTYFSSCFSSSLQQCSSSNCADRHFESLELLCFSKFYGSAEPLGCSECKAVQIPRLAPLPIGLVGQLSTSGISCHALQFAASELGFSFSYVSQLGCMQIPQHESANSEQTRQQRAVDFQSTDFATLTA